MWSLVQLLIIFPIFRVENHTLQIHTTHTQIKVHNIILIIV